MGFQSWLKTNLDIHVSLPLLLVSFQGPKFRPAPEMNPFGSSRRDNPVVTMHPRQGNEIASKLLRFPYRDYNRGSILAVTGLERSLRRSV